MSLEDAVHRPGAMRRRRLLIGAAGTAWATGAAIVAAAARAQGFPGKPLRLNEEINKALASADVKARLEKEGAPVLAPPEALGTHIAADIERWQPVVKAANIRLE